MGWKRVPLDGLIGPEPLPVSAFDRVELSGHPLVTSYAHLSVPIGLSINFCSYTSKTCWVLF